MKAATFLILSHYNIQSISIHAAREGGDVAFSPAVNYRNKFQSTPPVKAATPRYKMLLVHKPISIHAAREGGDPVAMTHPRLLCISIHAAREGGDAIIAAIDTP